MMKTAYIIKQQKMQFKQILKQRLIEDFQKKLYSNLIFLCIGTDRITGDCFGPLVGQQLEDKWKKNNRIKVYGTLENPILYTNVQQYVENIKNKCKNPYWILIDAGLSTSIDIGKVEVKENGIYLGSSIGKKNIYLGNTSIIGITGKKQKSLEENFQVLQCTSLYSVMQMAEMTSNGIMEVIDGSILKI